MTDTFDDIERQVNQFCNAWRALDLIYEEYAKAVHMPYTSLRILNLIARKQACTQKAICEHTFLPKQTVNSIVTGFYRKGLVELREAPEDRRTKTIHLTEAGRTYSDGIIHHIRNAERMAMASLTQAQRVQLIESMYLYGRVFRDAMLEK